MIPYRLSPQFIAPSPLGIQSCDVNLVDVVRVLQIRHGVEHAILPGVFAAALHQVDVRRRHAGAPALYFRALHHLKAERHPGRMFPTTRTFQDAREFPILNSSRDSSFPTIVFMFCLFASLQISLTEYEELLEGERAFWKHDVL